jgi:quercetin dioxygenase-like cupin family protein
MSPYTLRLFVDTAMATDAAMRLGSGINRVLYVAAGSIAVTTADGVCSLSSNSAWHGRGASVRPGGDGARVLRFELIAENGGDASDPDGEAVFQAPIRIDPSKTYLMRCDRVDLPPGSVRQLHVHAGPGIRYLMSGGFHVETLGRTFDLSPGQAWFETGPDPVFAASSRTEASSFVRLLVLPSEFLGRRSGRTLHKEDENKVTPSTTELFIDVPITLQSTAAAGR